MSPWPHSCASICATASHRTVSHSSICCAASRSRSHTRPSIIVSSIRGDLGLKTLDSWKLIDSSGGGDGNSWNSKNQPIPGAAGTNRGILKQLFLQALDLGEDDDLIVGLSNNADSLSNAYEIAIGLDTDSPKGAAADLDGDGSRNRDEMVGGTDPRNATDFLRILETSNQAETITFSWPSVVGRTYRVFWSTDLITWQPDADFPGTGGTLDATLDTATLVTGDAPRASACEFPCLPPRSRFGGTMSEPHLRLIPIHVKRSQRKGMRRKKNPKSFTKPVKRPPKEPQVPVTCGSFAWWIDDRALFLSLKDCYLIFVI